MENVALLVSVCVFGALSLAVVVAAVVLAVSRTVQHWVQTQQTISTIVRHQDDATTFERKAVADALRAGAQTASLEVGQPAPRTRPYGQVQDMLEKTTEDLGLVNQ